MRALTTAAIALALATAIASPLPAANAKPGTEPKPEETVDIEDNGAFGKAEVDITINGQTVVEPPPTPREYDLSAGVPLFGDETESDSSSTTDVGATTNDSTAESDSEPSRDDGCDLSYVPTRTPADLARYKVQGTAGKGDLYRMDCKVALTFDTNKLVDWQTAGYTFLPYAEPVVPGQPARRAPAPPPPPPPDPRVLAYQLFKDLQQQVPQQQISIGPMKWDEIIVKVPQWLSVNDPGAQTASLTFRGVTVTMTTRLESVDWTMGEPKGDPDQGATDPATVSCAGPGEPAPPIATLPEDAKTWAPPCGYTFRWRSIPERTGGSGTWPVRAVVHWNAHWEANTGDQGDIPLQRTAQTAVKTWELRVQLVNDPNYKQPPPTR
ncbi:hypothetical protein [Nakamurella aerolata]|uniref:Uncharacterized protein n=1 Tax=Nakamurella aerolata TaxID=1656892 RepID=A0A849AFE4_9ACTN|nr:hypothetical protein [Nakamurella aerolata]NNG37190.1 hypothetical protein [Nakamurella aerolata]